MLNHKTNDCLLIGFLKEVSFKIWCAWNWNNFKQAQRGWILEGRDKLLSFFTDLNFRCSLDKHLLQSILPEIFNFDKRNARVNISNFMTEYQFSGELVSQTVLSLKKVINKTQFARKFSIFNSFFVCFCIFFFIFHLCGL